MNKIMHPIEPEELMAYLDGELTANRAAEAANHMGECAECQSIVAGFRGVSQNLTAWKAELAESDMPQAIATTLAESRPSSRNIFPAWRSWRKSWISRWPMAAWVSAVAGIFLVVLGTVRYGRQVDYAVVNQPPDAQVETRLPPPAPPPSSPAAAPVNGRQFDRLQQFAKPQNAPPVEFKAAQQNQS